MLAFVSNIWYNSGYALNQDKINHFILFLLLNLCNTATGMMYVPMFNSSSSSLSTRLSIFSESLGKLAVENIVESSSMLSLVSSVSTSGACLVLLPFISLRTEPNIPYHAKYNHGNHEFQNYLISLQVCPRSFHILLHTFFFSFWTIDPETSPSCESVGSFL